MRRVLGIRVITEENARNLTQSLDLSASALRYTRSKSKMFIPKSPFLLFLFYKLI